MSGFRLSQKKQHTRAGGAFAFLLVFLIASHLSAADPASGLKRIYIVHFSHTDFGYTDIESVTRELHRRYLDVALDAVLATMNGPDERKFSWTAETLVAAQDWWDAASPARRQDFLRAVRSGQLEVTALPFNQSPFLNRAQWVTMMHWIPDDLWRQFKPVSALQNDVNGFPRAGAIALLDRGIRRLGMGINADSGGSPVPRPSAFWWKMPDGRRLFVWLNEHYASGYDYFESSEWRRGPIPSAADTRFRPARSGDFFRTDESSLRAAHRQCLKKIAELRRNGYRHNVLTVFFTNRWRIDNDPPFPPLADFVAAWNRLGLEPELRLAILSRALEAMEKEAGPHAPEYEGEFTDWWANGTASAPREVAASRRAKRLLAAARSPLWGEPDQAVQKSVDALYKDLCLFDEHTWGSSWSVARPDGADTAAQFAAKSMFAYRALAHAEWLLSQRVRSRILPEGEGLYIAHPAKRPFSGWVKMPVGGVRSDFRSVEDPATGERIPIFFEKGFKMGERPRNPAELSRENSAAQFSDNVPNQVAKFWMNELEGNVLHKFRLSTRPAEKKTTTSSRPTVIQDSEGWPESVQWPAMKKPLFLPGMGTLSIMKVHAFAPRWALRDIAEAGDDPSRDRLRQGYIKVIPAFAEGKATVEETPDTVIFTQSLRHPRLRWGVRTMEIWKDTPHARITLRFYRLSSDDPEIFHLAFPFPCQGILPRASCGGQPFTPFADQIPGSCRDYMAIDGWVEYRSPDGQWLWVSHDAPLVTFGSPQIWARRRTAPSDSHRVSAVLFDNIWYTNFVGDEHGTMEFRFDMIWRDRPLTPDQLSDWADSLTAEPVVLINSDGSDAPAMLQRLFRP